MKFGKLFLLCGRLLTLSTLACSAAEAEEPSANEWDDNRPAFWGREFKEVEINSSGDGMMQRAYFFKSQTVEKQPLLVSLHTWSGDYKQKCPLAAQAKSRNWNYIHPDFRGPNKRSEACLSNLVLTDIDDAIDYAMKNAAVDPEQVYVIGASGGGMAALGVFMKSRHRIRSIEAWVPISNLAAMYEETRGRGLQYYKDILQCIGSTKTLDLRQARDRSPYYWKTPMDRKNNTALRIYAGIHDGYTGAIPITQSLKFYNKVIGDLGCKDKTAFVSLEEMLYMLETRRSPLKTDMLDSIGGRAIHYRKTYENIQIVIFEGGHEMLSGVALDLL